MLYTNTSILIISFVYFQRDYLTHCVNAVFSKKRTGSENEKMSPQGVCWRQVVDCNCMPALMTASHTTKSVVALNLAPADVENATVDMNGEKNRVAVVSLVPEKHRQAVGIHVALIII